MLRLQEWRSDGDGDRPVVIVICSAKRWASESSWPDKASAVVRYNVTGQVPRQHETSRAGGGISWKGSPSGRDYRLTLLSRDGRDTPRALRV